MAVSNFYRSDGWVKTVQGPAVPGAQIYVCTQPANVTPPATPPRTTPVPWQGPNPQAQIFSDNGLTPIVQPIITDGFGHYDFYALPGLYTVVVMFGGKVQQVYVDQSLGNVGTSNSSSIQLLTNGSPNFNQFVQNLVQGSGMTIVTDNLGNTVFTSTGGAGISLKTNGTPNASQSLLNMVNGSNISIVSDGSGNTTINSTLATNSSSWFLSIQDVIAGASPTTSIPYTDGIAIGAGCMAVQVNLDTPVTVRKISNYVFSGSPGQFCYMAVYSADGSTKIIDPGANTFDIGTSSTVRTVTLGTPVVLSPGCYLVAWNASSATPEGLGIVSNAMTYPWWQLLGANSARLVRGTNAVSAGSMPASLGTIALPGSGQLFGFPIFLFE